ncbi:hypothetical protein [Leptospira interrogans]|uniref:hypothetical protein n=1 Tax=Leptospira interrogans TaxID=173 RepID=UPI0002B9139F|nr:hypothetical protein [Leptospira interrogans]EMN93365.1 hypothetical protein LEP1GSC110_3558 [Leptospira interrogans serovar Medanensis str. UT053]EMO00924.1 hypothetical protein LEP1GSC112_0456 [Leptospira interrogans serovar Pomona str. UT364]
MAEDPNKIILERHHPDISARLEAYQLITDSFHGGLDYIRKDYLVQYLKETSNVYENRKKRSVFLNHTAPIVDVLVGLLFNEKPNRKVPSEIEDILLHANKRQSFQEFFQEVATKSLLNTCGILVDSPSFDPNEIKTQAARKAAGLQPYLVLYELNQIRDFSVNEAGELLWILLDNTYEEDEDPFRKRKTITQYRLWTKTTYQDFTKGDKDQVVTAQAIPHNIGKVPFVFVSWNDKTKTLINQTVFEDIAIIDRKIYNYLSVADEVIYSGSFALFAYPGSIPDAIEKSGLASLDWITFDSNSSHLPTFISHGIEALSGIVSFIDSLAKKILQKVGLDKDEEKSGVQSGKAKLLEYKVANAFLLSGATRLEKAEIECLELALSWLSSELKASEISVTYKKKFESVDIDKAINTLLTIFNDLKYTAVKKRVAKEIVNTTFPEIPEKEKNELFDEIDNTNEDELPGFVKKYIEEQSNNSAAPSDNGAKKTNGSSSDTGTKLNPGGDPDNSASG